MPDPQPPARGPATPLLAALVLAAGYADLWRGGTVAAPVLLVVGYAVLVPLAILRGGRRRPDASAGGR